MFGSKKITLDVNGMSCEKCVARVKKALEGVDGVKSADVNLDKKRAVVKYEGEVSGDTLVKAVTDAGYEAAVA